MNWKNIPKDIICIITLAISQSFPKISFIIIEENVIVQKKGIRPIFINLKVVLLYSLNNLGSSSFKTSEAFWKYTFPMDVPITFIGTTNNLLASI